MSPPTIAVNGDPLQINGVVGDIIAADLITQLTIFGGSGHDVIDASALSPHTMPNLDRGGVRIHSGLGRDGVVGSQFDDYIDAGPGKDVVYGRGGDDHLIGGDDLDSLFGEEGDDLLDPGNRLGIQSQISLKSSRL